MPPQIFTKQAALKYLLELCKDFGKVHKHFLQLMMKQRHLGVSLVGKVFIEIWSQVDDDNDGNNKRKLRALGKIMPDENQQITRALLPTLNKQLIELGLRIVQFTNEYYRRMNYWVLVSEVHFSTGLLNSNSLHKDEVAMFHHWLKLLFIEYKTEEETPDSVVEDVGIANDRTTSGELNLTKALLYAKKKGWTMKRSQNLLDKLQQQKWIRVIKSVEPQKGKKRRKTTITDEAIIRLQPCAVAELEQLLIEDLHVPVCMLCKRPVVVSRLCYTCDNCKSNYHACCMLRDLEFPAQCAGEDCSVELTEDLLDAFAFNIDPHCIRPRRRTNNSGPNISAATSSTSSTTLVRNNKLPFSSLLEF